MTTLALLLDIDRIGQLVHVVAGAREVLAEGRARGLDGLDDPLGELAVLEADGELGRDLVPEAGGHLLVDALVAEDGGALLLGGDEEEHAVAQRGLGHAQALEGALGHRADLAAVGLRLHVNADLTRGGALRVLDRGDDAVLIELCQKFLLRHHPPPEAPPPPNELPPPPHPPPTLHPPPPLPPPLNPPPPKVPPPPPPQNIGQMQPLHPPHPPRRIIGPTTKMKMRTMKIRNMMSRGAICAEPLPRCVADVGRLRLAGEKFGLMRFPSSLMAASMPS